MVLLASVALSATGCGAGDDSSGARATGAWHTLPEAPLSPRDDAVVVGVGGQVLVVGGWEFLCPPMADCALPEAPLLDDGAVYDPAADAWRPISPPPFGVRATSHDTTAVGDTAYLLTGCAAGPDCGGPLRLLSYDLTADRWDDRGRVPGDERYRQVTAAGRDLVVYAGSDEHGEVPDLAYDPARSSWSRLPDDPLPRTFDRFVVPVGDQLVLAGSPTAGVDAGKNPPKLAARYDLGHEAWTRLPDAPGPGYQLFPGDGGPVLDGHFGESPGWVLDPGTWTWSPLPDEGGGHDNVSGVLERDGAVYDLPGSAGSVASGDVYVYDSTALTFVAVPAPPDREDVYDDSSTALGRDLVVFGGQRWSGGGAGDGELVADARLWTAPAR
ncbi:hypothetical protein [Nocardioides taihuensis]|uniref:Galactose oxidase n=1 Tax=Nocardioides taihuensis TaxID=1835606 RepID=A0ABW0BP77_9ACTN